MRSGRWMAVPGQLAAPQAPCLWHAARVCGRALNSRRRQRSRPIAPQQAPRIIQCCAVDAQAEGEPLAELSSARHIITVDGFSPDLVAQLRRVFDDRFDDPRRTHAQRFMWDHWWCPDAHGTTQYHLVRTQAQAYFAPEQHAALADALLAYGEAQLGCRAITPIWMSYYTDGMLQELHADNPHGPFAFVLSLTHWEGREFSGGETQLLRATVLDYWNRADLSTGMEHADLVQLIPPLFGRLTIFDPRFPHGVRRVHGSHDPRKARLVLHGWFTDPAPFIEGGLSAASAAPVLDATLAGAIDALQEPEEGEDGQDVASLGAHPCAGVLTLRLHVDGSSGQVQDVSFLADTLVPLPAVGVDPKAVRATIQNELHAWFMDAEFPVAEDGTDTFITLPVVFQ